MSQKNWILTSIVAFALLAGCSEAPPAGTLRDLSFSPPVAGDASFDYQAFTGDETSGVPVVGGNLQCQAPGPAGPVVTPCKMPYTDVKVNATLPKGGDAKWSLYLVNATSELLVAELAEGPSQDKTATYTGGKNYTEDLTGRYSTVELRLGSFLFASADVKEGSNPLAMVRDASLVAVTDATFDGHTLTATVAGLPANATYRGNLYLRDANGAAHPEPAESFAIDGNGPISYTSTEHNVADFAEFHIHVGDSMVNLYKAAIETVES